MEANSERQSIYVNWFTVATKAARLRETLLRGQHSRRRRSAGVKWRGAAAISHDGRGLLGDGALRSGCLIGYSQTASRMAAPNEKTVTPKKKPTKLRCSRDIGE